MLLCIFLPLPSLNAFPPYFSSASATRPGSLYFYPELITAETITVVRGYCSNSVSFQCLFLVHAGTYWNTVCV